MPPSRGLSCPSLLSVWSNRPYPRMKRLGDPRAEVQSGVNPVICLAGCAMGRSLANFSGRVRRQNEVLPCFVTLVCRKSIAGYVSTAIHQCAFITVDALSDD